MYDTNTSSIAKTQIDAWYQNNITSQDEEVISLIEDTIYCNDTTVSSTVYGNTYYGTNKTPQYKCPQVSDAYTVSSDYGNGKLTYTVALLTCR